MQNFEVSREMCVHRSLFKGEWGELILLAMLPRYTNFLFRRYALTPQPPDIFWGARKVLVAGI